MADSTTEEEGKTSPRDSPFTDPPTTRHQEDIQRKLDDALNSNKEKDDEITRLTRLCNSTEIESQNYRLQIIDARKEAMRLDDKIDYQNVVIKAQEESLLNSTALYNAELARRQTLENSLEAKAAAQEKSNWERLLKAKDSELEKLKKEIEMKDAKISELLNGFSTRRPRTRKNKAWEVPSSESSPIVRPTSVGSVELVELLSEVGDESKNTCDFVDEMLEDCCPAATPADYRSDTSEDMDGPKEDSDDLDYDPNPNWYRNKIVKKLKIKRNSKAKAIKAVKKLKRKRNSKAKAIEAKGSGTTTTDSLECPICPLREDGTRLIYSGVTGLNYHMSINHPDHPGFHTERFQCSDCPEIFVRKVDLQKHLKSAHMEVRYKCQFCPKDFSSSHYCDNHERLHKNTDGGPAVLKCGKCSKVFFSNVGLHHHQVTIHPHGGGCYKCNHCDASFMHINALRLHNTTNHRAKNFKCPLCPKTYTKRGGLRRHSKSHSTDPTDIRPGRGGVGGGLRHSIEAKRQLLLHLESKNVKLDLANQSPSSTSAVIQEFIPGIVSEITLDGPEETTCQFCGMEFSYHRQLKIHRSRHRFKCIKCVDMFDQPSSLRYHLSVTHKVDGEEAEELLKEGVQPIESQTAPKTEPCGGPDLCDDFDIDQMLN